MFTELARRMALNLNQYPDGSERYGRLAFRAQSNCRATLEALAKLHQPREQTVRHIHVNEGGQAIVADQFHQHTRGDANAKTTKQSHATRAARESAPLPSPNAERGGMPITGGSRQKEMPDAWGNESGSPMG